MNLREFLEEKVDEILEGVVLPKGRTPSQVIHLITEGRSKAGWKNIEVDSLNKLLPGYSKGRQMKTTLLAYYNVKYCNKCSNVKSLEDFSKGQSKCKGCNRAYMQTLEPTAVAEYQRKYQEENKEGIIENKHRYYLKNIVHLTEYAKEYYDANKEGMSAKRAEYNKVYTQRPEVKAANRAKANKYRASKLGATPAWCETEEIKQLYLECPENYHVDHIVPLQGKLVSGLHVLVNLQYLTAKENRSKSNKFDPLTEGRTCT